MAKAKVPNLIVSVEERDIDDDEIDLLYQQPDSDSDTDEWHSQRKRTAATSNRRGDTRTIEQTPESEIAGHLRDDLSAPAEESGDNVTAATAKGRTANSSAAKKFSNRNSLVVSQEDLVQDAEKRQLRARRFNLPDDSSSAPLPQQQRPLNEQTLQGIYAEFGIEDDSDMSHRLDGIFIHGVQNMTAQSIFDYFGEFAPSEIERLSNASCIVIWSSKDLAARALAGISRPLKRIENEHKSTDASPERENADFISPLMRKSTEEGDEITNNSASVMDVTESSAPMPKVSERDAYEEVDARRFQIPSGHWRVGRPTPHSDLILMRFARKDDDQLTVDSVKRFHTGINSRKRKFYADVAEEEISSTLSAPSFHSHDDLRRNILRREAYEENLDDRVYTDYDKPSVADDDVDSPRWLRKRAEESDSDDERMRGFSRREQGFVCRETKKPRMQMRADEEDDNNSRKQQSSASRVGSRTTLDLRKRLKRLD